MKKTERITITQPVPATRQRKLTEAVCEGVWKREKRAVNEGRRVGQRRRVGVGIGGGCVGIWAHCGGGYEEEALGRERSCGRALAEGAPPQSSSAQRGSA